MRIRLLLVLPTLERLVLSRRLIRLDAVASPRRGNETGCRHRTGCRSTDVVIDSFQCHHWKFPGGHVGVLRPSRIGCCMSCAEPTALSAGYYLGDGRETR